MDLAMRTGAAPSSASRAAFVVILASFASGIGGCSKLEETVSQRESSSEPIHARVLKVAEQAWPLIAPTQGDLVADETTVVGAKVAGRVDHVLVDLGDSVKAGTVLASLDRQEHEERVRQSEAELTQVRAAIGLDKDDDLDRLDPKTAPIVVEQKALWDQAQADRSRVEALHKRNAATDTQLAAVIATEEVAKARLASALNSVRENIALVRVRTAQLELARQQFADAEIRAPFDGRVQERHVAAGTYVQVGAPVVTLIRDDPLRFRGTVPEIYASSIGLGQQVRLRTAQGPTLPEVPITRISPALDPLSRSLLFEALVPNANHAIQAGQFAQGEVLLDQSRRTIALPKSAIVQFAGTQKVWKVVDGQAVEGPVETGDKRNDVVEILSGVKVGDQVLIDGSKGRSAKVEIEETVAQAGEPQRVANTTSQPR
jgi:RND family efflux transporter MFP subunit